MKNTIVVYGDTALNWLENQLDAQRIPHFIRVMEDINIVKIDTEQSEYIDSLRRIIAMRNDTYLNNKLKQDNIIEDYKEMLK